MTEDFINHILNNNTVYASHKLELIEHCVKNKEHIALIVKYLNDASSEDNSVNQFIFFLTHCQLTMSVESLSTLIPAGLKLGMDVEQLLSSTVYHQKYNPLIFYLIENYSLLQPELDLIHLDTNGDSWIGSWYCKGNIPFINNLIKYSNIHVLTQALEGNRKSYIHNVLSNVITQFGDNFFEHIELLKQFNFDFNRYLLIEQNKFGEDTKMPSLFYLLSPLSLAKKVNNSAIINFFMNEPSYQLGEFEEALGIVSKIDLIFQRGEAIKKGQDKWKVLEEKYRVESKLTQNVISKPASIKL
jgi:hypothetical protein